MLLMQQIMPHCMISLQIIEQGTGESQKYEGQRQISICNATRSTFNEYLQMDQFRSHKAHDFNRAAFDTYEVISPRNVRFDDDNMAEGIGMTSIVVGVETKDKMKRIWIKNVLHVPKLQANLLSVSKFVDTFTKTKNKIVQHKPKCPSNKQTKS